ncbi:MAG: glycosyltransferase family 4 protein [Treponemataceae bacterium]
MKIYGIHLIDKLITGGDRRYVDLMNGLAESGNEVCVFVNEKFIHEFYQCKTIPVNLTFKKKQRISVQVRTALKKLLVKQNQSSADYIIIFGETNWGAAKMLSKKTEAKIIFAYRSSIIEENRTILKYEKLQLTKKIILYLEILLTRLREKNIAHMASKITFQTDFDKNNFLRRNKKAEAKCVVIRNDILRSRFSYELKNKNTSRNCKNLLYVGNYTERKGFSILLDALIILKSKGIHFNLSILSPVEFPEHLKEKKELIENNLVFLPKSNNAMYFMIQSDLVIIPSLFDSYPNVIMEAIHTGTPVIGGNYSGMKYMLAEPDLLFQNGSSESLAKKLEQCISDVDYYQHIRELCLSRRNFFEFDWIAEWNDIMQS